MGELLEDEIAAFVRKRRPLKLLFMAVGLLGILGSAVTTLKPIYDRGKPYVLRTLGIELDRSEKQRFGCAYELGQARSNLDLAVGAAGSFGDKTKSAAFNSYRDMLTLCQATLGTPYHAVPIIFSADAHQAFSDSVREAEGTLRAKDHASSAFFDLGQATEAVIKGFQPGSGGDALRFPVPLNDQERNALRDAQEKRTEAAKLCPCKIPEFQTLTEVILPPYDRTRTIRNVASSRPGRLAVDVAGTPWANASSNSNADARC